MSYSKQAFTLVELSIALIIIGLLITGIVGGQKLINKAKLNKMITEIKNIEQAVTIFKLTYEALPGDMVDFSSYFTGQTNGDGNGGIEFTESQKAWEHLNISQLYISPTQTEAIPTKSFANVNKRFIWIDSSTTWSTTFQDSTQDKTTIQIGKGNTNDPAFIPKDQYSIDKKIDDTLPKSGIVTYRVGDNTNDTTCTGSATGTTYNLSSTAQGCNIVYVLEIQ